METEAKCEVTEDMVAGVVLVVLVEDVYRPVLDAYIPRYSTRSKLPCRCCYLEDWLVVMMMLSRFGTALYWSDLVGEAWNGVPEYCTPQRVDRCDDYDARAVRREVMSLSRVPSVTMEELAISWIVLPLLLLAPYSMPMKLMIGPTAMRNLSKSLYGRQWRHYFRSRRVVVMVAAVRAMVVVDRWVSPTIDRSMHEVRSSCCHDHSLGSVTGRFDAESRRARYCLHPDTSVMVFVDSLAVLNQMRLPLYSQLELQFVVDDTWE